MIEFFSENDFVLEQPQDVASWIHGVIEKEGFVMGDITYIFCNDENLHKMNVEFLNHDTFTDIISFDYSLGKEIHGEIYISTERVEENAREYNVSFENELRRVMIHGILHFIGYGDKTEREQKIMRAKEDLYLSGYEGDRPPPL